MSPRKHNGPGIVSHAFACALCPAEAETITLVPAGTPYRYGGSPEPWVMVHPPHGGSIVFNAGSEAAELDPEAFELVRQALENGNADLLHRLQPFWVARYCPECAAHYCTRHWKLEVTVPSWGDAYSMDFVTKGTCPVGHTREVER